VMDTLLANEYDRDMFHLIYPFSPALMETLIAASSMLQRERTALKVMLQLLVDQQATLKVGDIVPVGDLYDAVAHGDEAFSQDMKVHFDNARKLFEEVDEDQYDALDLEKYQEDEAGNAYNYYLVAFYQHRTHEMTNLTHTQIYT